MNATKFFIPLIAVLLLASCSTEEPTMPDDSASARSEAVGKSSEFQVSRAMVDKFLRIAKKDKSVEAVVPMVRQGDTLAYYVQYAKGWDIISGDTRFAPVMIQSEDAPLDLIKDNPNKDVVNGLLAYIQDTRKSNEGKVNRIWNFLKPQNHMPEQLLSRRGGEEGMWIPQDTVYVEEDLEYIPHILQTKWGQGYPWNQFTKTIAGQHTKVGCVAVGTGQAIYHFRKTNNMGYSIPTAAVMPQADNTFPTFSNFSTSAWSLMAKNKNEIGTNYTAIFLSYLGKEINLMYDTLETSGYTEQISQALRLFGVSYDSTYSNLNNTIIDNLQYNKPLVCGAKCDFYSQSGHIFNIDSYKKRIYKTKVDLIWDPDYHYTEWDLRNYPPEFFKAPDTGHDPNPIKEHIINASILEFIAMNWGYNGQCDNTYYLIKSATGHHENDSFIITQTTDELPYWNTLTGRYTTVEVLLHNLRNAFSN